MDFGYAIQVLREKVVDDSYELTLAVEQKDEDMQERQKERLAILQDAMNALAKLSIVPQANELLPHVVGRSEQLKAFAQFLYNKEYLVRRSIDEAIEEFEKSL
jgi:hypothetical protein